MLKAPSASEGKALHGAQILPIDLIDPNPYQPRSEITPDSISDLVESVKELGVLQPLLVSRKGDRFILIAGHRRMAASKLSGLTEAPCIIKELAETDLIRYSLVENLQREDLTPLEEAASLQQLIDTQSLDYRKVAQLIGKSKSYVGERLDLLKLPDDLRAAVAQSKLSLKKAIELMKVEDIGLRAKLIEKGATGDLAQFKLLIEAALEMGKKGRKKRETWDVMPELKEFSQKAKGVRLYRDRISFKFKSPQDLRDLLREVVELIGDDTDRRFES